MSDLSVSFGGEQPTLHERDSQTVILRPQRSIGSDIIADCVLEEIHSDEMEITQHPVQEGTTISDHAYRRPTELTLTYIWSGGGRQNVDRSTEFLVDTYTMIRQIYSDRNPLRVITGKATYNNMMIQGISVTTDRASENVLIARITLQELLVATVSTSTMAADPSHQTQPQKTNPVTNKGAANLDPSGGIIYNPSVATVQNSAR
jgi:hypothetical protein